MQDEEWLSDVAVVGELLRTFLRGRYGNATVCELLKSSSDDQDLSDTAFTCQYRNVCREAAHPWDVH